MGEKTPNLGKVSTMRREKGKKGRENEMFNSENQRKRKKKESSVYVYPPLLLLTPKAILTHPHKVALSTAALVTSLIIPLTLILPLITRVLYWWSKSSLMMLILISNILIPLLLILISTNITIFLINRSTSHPFFLSILIQILP